MPVALTNAMINFHQIFIWISQTCVSVYVTVLDSHVLLPTGTSRSAVKQLINNTCQSGVFM